MKRQHNAQESGPMKKLVVLLAGILVSCASAQTVTPNLGLTLPAQNAPNWGVTLNNNFSIIDTFAGSAKIVWPGVDYLVVSNGTNSPAGLVSVLGECAVGGAGGVWTTGSCSGTVTFASIMGGVNTTSTMTVGTGASLGVSGSGTITATAMPASGLTGTALPSSIVTSSLTALGTIATGTWQGAIVAAGYGGTGVANTATLTLGSSNQNWATIGTGIVKVTTTTGAITDAASADVIALWTGTCNSTTFFRGDGACAAASAGDTITSPHSTIAVGGTATATQLDVVGAAGQILAGATPALTATPTLGTDNSAAGTLQLANGSANAHTIWGSGATTSNTILGFATAPTTGDLVGCTTSSTTCTLTDTAILATNVVTLAGSQTLTNKTLTSPILGGTPDASGATQFKLPVAAGGASAANGEKIYDTTNLNWHTWGNGVDNLEVLVPASVTITNGDCMQWVKVGGVITASDSGSACGSGGGGTAFSALTNGTNTAAAMLVGTGASLGVSGSGTISATSVPFSGVGAATNTNALVIGTGGSLAVSGSGTIAATSAPFAGIASGTNATAAMVVGTGASLGTSGSGTITATSAAAVLFSGVGAATNTNALVIGTGGSLTVSGSGTNNATSVNGNTFPASAGLTAGQFIVPSTSSAYGLSGVNLTWSTPTLTIGVAGTTAGRLALASSTATGSVTLQSASAASAFTVTVPAATDTLVNLAGSQTLTNKTLTSPVLGGTPDASGATQFKHPVGSGYVSAANGELGYDSTNLNWHVWGNAVDNYMALVPVSTAPVNGDCVDWVVAGGVTVLGDAGAACGAGGASAWSSLTNPSASLTLSMGIHATTFNYTSALSGAFLWANSTAASSGTSASSPILSLCGNAWHAGASAQDCLTLQDQPGNGTDAGIIFNIAHSGSSTGSVTTVHPGPVQAGASGGVGGTLNLPEGTTQSASANNDICYADSALHGIKCSFNNASFLPMVLSAVSVTSADAPSYNGTGGGLLQDSGVSLLNSSVAIPSGQCLSINGDSFLCRFGAGSFEMGGTANSTTGVLELTDVTTLYKTSTLFTQLIGTTFTTSNGCSESGTLVGEGVGGHLTAETSVACSTTITMGGGASATHGWVCDGIDATTKTNPVYIVPASATTVTLSGTFLSGDVLWFSCHAV